MKTFLLTSLLLQAMPPSELDTMVRAFHVPSVEWVLSLDADDVSYLLELAEDPSLSPIVRARALGFTTYHRNDLIEPRWRALLEDSNPMLRREAAWRLIHSAIDQKELLKIATELRAFGRQELQAVALDGLLLHRSPGVDRYLATWRALVPSESPLHTRFRILDRPSAPR